METQVIANDYVTCLRDSLCFKMRYIVSCVGVQQKELASELGMDESNLSRVLNSKFNFGVDTLLRIVDRLGFEISITLNPPVDIALNESMSLDEINAEFEKIENYCHE